LYVNIDDNLVAFVKIWSTVGPLRVELMTLSRRTRRTREEEEGKVERKEM
jgi:hypothetical protein